MRKPATRLAVSVASVALLTCALAQAGPTLYVDASAAPGGDGASAESALTSVQVAVDRLPESGGLVLVAPGEYAECIRLRPGVEICGPDDAEEGPLGQAVAAVRSPDGSTPVVIEKCGGVVIRRLGVTGSRRCGVYVARSEALLDGLHIHDNIAGIRGGGIGRDPDDERDVIPPAEVEEGGGVSAWDSTLRLVDCRIEGNSAAIRGGGLWGKGGDVHIDRCLIAGNGTEDAGGGVYLWAGTHAIDSSVLSGNWAYRGGGAFAGQGASVALRGCTIADNSARRTGGLYSQGSSLSAEGCIIWGNGKSLSSVKARRCCVEGGAEGEGNIASNPLLGGPGGYHLTPSSPCIDAWGATDAPPDLDSQPREGPADMGAYEFVSDEGSEK